MPFSRTDEAYLRRKKDVPTDLTTREMQLLDAQLRERMFWSATVNNARVVQNMHAVSNALASGKISMSDARLTISKMLQKTGYKPADGTKGSIRDLTTTRRLNLILQTNLEMARGYAHHAEAQEDLDLYPCQELIRIRNSRVPRDWKTRWHASGGKLYNGRMIAEINSPIWKNISRFDLPYPPFDFNSGMGVMPIRRDEAIKLGVISKDSVQERKELPSMNENLEAQIENATPELKAKISEQLQGLAQWQGDKLVFTDPNGTKPYSDTAIVNVLKNKITANIYGAGVDPNHQRNALIEWTKNSNYIKNHTTTDKAYHFGRLLNRIEPMESSEEIYRGMSWNTKVESQKMAFDKFLAEVDSGDFTRSTFESYTKNIDTALEYGAKHNQRVFITVIKHGNAKYIGNLVKHFHPDNAQEMEVLFSKGGKMKILKKEVKGDTIYLTVEEVL
ncbi:MAG: hypothetical protein E7035_07350 [Verrucomicrobiaceae bacterium]|nr:hypothetical protein [Verrucomicrobiaceae bacterium]